jgi:hypothetical protein
MLFNIEKREKHTAPKTVSILARIHPPHGMTQQAIAAVSLSSQYKHISVKYNITFIYNLKNAKEFLKICVFF